MTTTDRISNSYNRTIISCFVGYIVQAIVNNYIPLLFITLQGKYQIPLAQITLLITVNFVTQLIVDLLSAFFVDKIGYRISIVSAHICAATGLILLAILPEHMPAFTGILIAVIIYAIGGGLIEVLISPIMESCPTGNKEKAMSLLHSFYCWGQVGVVLLSTIFFRVIGIEHYRFLSCIWAMVPILNAISFLTTPIGLLIPEHEEQLQLGKLLTSKVFWILVLMMTCAGASELAVSQWSSFFAEEGLGVSKTVGDLAGPMAFAALMGGARAFYGRFGDKFSLDRFMMGSGILCVCSYLVISLVPSPVINLIGCAICGLSVGILWPGTFSKAAGALKNGGTALFSLLALAGDLGCSVGPTLVGLVSDHVSNHMKYGILAAGIFPAGIVAGILMLRKHQ